MDSQNYYTDNEMLQKMQQLTNEGKSLLEICSDPRCQPDVKEKLEALEKLGWHAAALQYIGKPSLN